MCLYFHYITIRATVFCPPFGSYLRNCLLDWVESWLIGTIMKWLIRNTHIIKCVSIPICGFMFFHYIPIAIAAFCPPFGSYLRKCMCILAESWLVGMAMRWLVINIHKIRGVSIPFCVFMYFHYITITATVFCPPFGSYRRNCLCDWAESWLIGTAIRCCSRTSIESWASRFLFVGLCILVMFPQQQIQFS